MRRKASHTLTAFAGDAAIAACAGVVAVESWVQGAGECTAVGSEGNTIAARVEVGDGTWTATVADEGFPTAGNYEGT